jgi:hypothetical protein
MKLTLGQIKQIVREELERQHNAILVERKTDILYVNISNWIYDKIMSGEYYTIGFNLKENNETFVELNSRSEYKGEFIAAMFDFFKGSDLKKGYEEYIKATGDDQILNTIEKFKTAFDKFYIYFYNFASADAAGSMSITGVMSLYDNFEELHGVKNRGTRTAGLDIFQKYLKKHKTTFIHEFTHYLNSIRSNHARYTSKGGDEQFKSRTKEYAESTEELQAYLIESYELIRRELAQGSMAVSTLAYALKRDDFDVFLRGYLKLTFAKANDWFDRSVDAADTRPGGIGDESGIISKQGKRIVNRIHEIFEQLKEEGLDKVAPKSKISQMAGSFDKQIDNIATTFVNTLEDNKLTAMAEIMNAVFKIANVSPGRQEYRTGLKGL